MDPITLHLRRQHLALDRHGRNCWRSDTRHRLVPADQVALILCDVWDRHWSRGANERLLALLPRMNAVVGAIRQSGAHIIHAPSETMEYYADWPARRRVASQARAWLAEHSVPDARAHDDPVLPIDASDGGSDTNEGGWYRAWQKQHPLIEIDNGLDVITDDGREVYAWLALQQVRQVLIMGVHTNLCILHRSFGIKQMVRWGVEIALVRDLTDAMYNPARPPYVSHDAGTRLVVSYIEKHWCPTIASQDLLS